MSDESQPLYSVKDFAGDYKLPAAYDFPGGNLEFGVPGYTYPSTRKGKTKGELLRFRDWKKVEEKLMVLGFDKIALKQGDDKNNILPGREALGLPELNEALLGVYSQLYNVWCSQFSAKDRKKQGKIMLISAYRRLGQTVERGKEFEDIGGSIDSTDNRGHWAGLAVDVSGGYTRDSFDPKIIGSGDSNDYTGQEPWISLLSSSSAMANLSGDRAHYRVKKANIINLGTYGEWEAYSDSYNKYWVEYLEKYKQGWTGWEDALKGIPKKSVPKDTGLNVKPEEHEATDPDVDVDTSVYKMPYHKEVELDIESGKIERDMYNPKQVRWTPPIPGEYLDKNPGLLFPDLALASFRESGVSARNRLGFQPSPSSLGFSHEERAPATPTKSALSAAAANVALARAARKRDLKQYIDTVNIETRGSFDAQKLMAALEEYGRKEVGNFA